MDTPAQVEVVGTDIDFLDDITELTHNCAFITDEDGNAVSGVVMVGKNSPQYVQVIKEQRVDNIMRAGKRKQAVDTATEAGATVVANTVARNDRATALAVCVGFFGFHRAGAPVPFTKETLTKMFDKCPQWQTKVLIDLEAEGNFTPASLKA